MARNKNHFQIKCRASSILEVVVAMVIMMLTFSLALMICSSVIRNGLSARKVKAAALAENEMAYKMDTLHADAPNPNGTGLRIEVSQVPFGNNETLQKITVSVHDENANLPLVSISAIKYQPDASTNSGVYNY